MGAGAAGLTAAVRAAHAGCRVLVLESAAETLATFRGNATRLLHPNLYAWPRPGWSNPQAELPILTWSAGPAAGVASAIDRAFRTEISRTGLIDCRTSATLAHLRPAVLLVVGGSLVPETIGLATTLATMAATGYVLVGIAGPPRASPGMQVTVIA